MLGVTKCSFLAYQAICKTYKRQNRPLNLSSEYGVMLHILHNILHINILDISRSGNKSSLVQLIQNYGLNVQVAFLGPNLEYAVEYFER